MSLTSQLSLETVCIPKRTWSRLTIDPVRILDHSKWGNWGAQGEVRIDTLASLGSCMKSLRRASIAVRLGLSGVADKPSCWTHGNSLESTLCLLVVLPSSGVPLLFCGGSLIDSWSSSSWFSACTSRPFCSLQGFIHIVNDVSVGQVGGIDFWNWEGWCDCQLNEDSHNFGDALCLCEW